MKYIGVTRHYNKWQATIGIKKKRKHLGTFETPEEAAKCYDLHAKDLGRKLNFPDKPACPNKAELIQLGNNKWAIVDSDIALIIKSYKWHISNEYAASKQTPIEKMHRFIYELKTGKPIPENLEIDHSNHNKLDNRFQNIRLVTHSQNMANTMKQQGAYTSKYKGVTWFRRDKKWKAQIRNNLKNQHIGYFADEIEAAKAYDEKAIELFGDCACLNFPISKTTTTPESQQSKPQNPELIPPSESV